MSPAGWCMPAPPCVAEDAAFHPFQYPLKLDDLSVLITDASLLLLPSLTNKKSEPEFPPPSSESEILKHPVT